MHGNIHVIKLRRAIIFLTSSKPFEFLENSTSVIWSIDPFWSSQSNINTVAIICEPILLGAELAIQTILAIQFWISRQTFSQFKLRATWWSFQGISDIVFKSLRNIPQHLVLFHHQHSRFRFFKFWWAGPAPIFSSRIRKLWSYMIQFHHTRFSLY